MMATELPSGYAPDLDDYGIVRVLAARAPETASAPASPVAGAGARHAAAFTWWDDALDCAIALTKRDGIRRRVLGHPSSGLWWVIAW